MPLRVKSRSSAEDDAGQRSPSLFGNRPKVADLPYIEFDDSFREVIKKLSLYITDAITLPCTFEQLRTTSSGDRLRLLVTHLSDTCDNPCIVNALLALKWHYGSASDDRGISEARASACEIVAWRFLTHLSEREAVDFCLYEIPSTNKVPEGVAPSGPEVNVRRPTGDEEIGLGGVDGTYDPDERSPLLSQLWSSVTSGQNRESNANNRPAIAALGPMGGSRRYQLMQSLSRLTMGMTYDHDSDSEDEEDDPTAPFVQLNALEIAAVADAKRFLGQNVVQKIITGIWNGDIVFWGRLEADAIKKPHFYNPHTSDPFSRLRVPKYLKSFEIVYFMAFLTIFYLTLLDRNPTRVSAVEGLFYVFLAAFAYDELSEWIDAGSLFYVYDFWNVFDLIMICVGITFAVLRLLGLWREDTYLIDISFDVLALEALFMVPRIFSVLSLSPYWGTLLPCFKEMTKDFIKFMVLVVVVYLGFLTTFSLIGRNAYTFPHMTMIVTKIFFGSSYVGFDIMDDIDPIFGPPLMLIFITLSSILLMGSLTGMLSNSFSRVMGHAREEYIYVYSIYVLEASTSNRLTHFYPPFNLLALIIFRPLRLFLPSDTKFRTARIALLKITHLPIVLVIQFYELVSGKIRHSGEQYSAIKGPRQQTPSAMSSNSRRFGSSSQGETTFRTSRRVLSRPSTGYRPSTSMLRSDVRPLSTSDLLPQPLAANVSSATTSPAAIIHTLEEDTEIETPSDTEIRMSELSARVERLEMALSTKMDKLAEMVMKMQESQTGAQ